MHAMRYIPWSSPVPGNIVNAVGSSDFVNRALGFAGDAGVRDETVAVAAVNAPFVRRERVIELRDHADLCRRMSQSRSRQLL